MPLLLLPLNLPISVPRTGHCKAMTAEAGGLLLGLVFYPSRWLLI
jgi:hypothetical protein